MHSTSYPFDTSFLKLWKKRGWGPARWCSSACGQAAVQNRRCSRRRSPETASRRCIPGRYNMHPQRNGLLFRQIGGAVRHEGRSFRHPDFPEPVVAAVEKLLHRELFVLGDLRVKLRFQRFVYRLKIVSVRLLDNPLNHAEREQILRRHLEAGGSLGAPWRYPSTGCSRSPPVK